MRPERRLAVRALRAAPGVLAAFAALLIALAVPPSARAWCRMTTSQLPAPFGMCPTGIPLEWHRPCSRYNIFADGSRTLPLATVRTIFETSFSQWESIDCTGVTVDGMPNLEAHLSASASQCDASAYVTGGANVSTIVFVQDWAARDYDSSAYAVTTVWHSTRTGEIYDVDMEINEDGHTYADCPAATGCADGRVDLQNVITHEAGHYFGLAHTPVIAASMFASSVAGEVGKRTLKPDDIEGFCTVYPPGHFDGVACNDTPRGGATLTCGAVDEGCGCSAVGAGTSTSALVGFALLALTGVVGARRRTRRAV